MSNDYTHISNKDTVLSYGKKFKFDDFDKAIIKELDSDCRLPLSEISSKVKLSRDAVRNRIKKLVDAQVILNFKPFFNPPNMGFDIINYVFLSLYNPSEKKDKEFLDYLKNNKSVVYIASLIGRWDYLIEIVAQDPGRFDKVLKQIRQKFYSIIKDYEVYGVLQEYKYETLGKLIYE